MKGTSGRKSIPLSCHGDRQGLAPVEGIPVADIGRATAAFEKLPLVQDKALLDNILYSGRVDELQTKAERGGLTDD